MDHAETYHHTPGMNAQVLYRKAHLLAVHTRHSEHTDDVTVVTLQRSHVKRQAEALPPSWPLCPPHRWWLGLPQCLPLPQAGSRSAPRLCLLSLP